MKKIHLALVSFGVAGLIAGCGGGGAATPAASGGTTLPTGLVKITPTNAQAVAKDSMGSSQGMAKDGGSQAAVIGVIAQPSARSPSILAIALAKYKQARSLNPTPVGGVIGVVTTLPAEDCTSGGTTTSSLDDKNNNSQFDTGDVISISFAACVELDGTSNGGMTFTINSGVPFQVSGGTPNAPLLDSFTMTFTSFTNTAAGETVTINGDLTMSTSDDGTTMTATMSGATLDVTSNVDGATQMKNYSLIYESDSVSPDTGPYSFEIAMDLATDLGVVKITTPTPFSGVGLDEPTAGVMVITGLDSSTLTLTALDAINVDTVLDVDGTGPTPPDDAVVADTTWEII